MRETELRLDVLAQAESLFALANGHLGLRGNLDEGEPVAQDGTYLTGYYESHPIAYGERGYGFPEDGQTIVNVTDGKAIRLLVEDEPLDIRHGTLHSHERILDLRSGVLTRELEWTSLAGRAVRVRSRRLVSLVERSVAAICYEVTALNEPMRVALQSNLAVRRDAHRPPADGDDPRRSAALGAVLEPCLHAHDGLRVVLAHRTRRSGLSLAAGMEHDVQAEGEPLTRTESSGDLGRVTFSAQITPGRPLRLVKLLAYHWSSRESIDWLRDQADASLENALAQGFDGLADAQRSYLDEYWDMADMVIDGDPEIQQAIRFAAFQLLQASARAETRAIGAKGLTGPGYDGHTFWDTETFVLPVLSHVRPQVARDALLWRHSTLDLARNRAHQLRLAGAAFPWRTIAGEECSGYWPAGTAALHVNADIAAAASHYVTATQDREFERTVGVPLLVETARLWASVGFHDEDGAFRIMGVTGPDEYSALVNDNTYTNLRAQANLRAAADAVARHPDAARDLGVDDREPQRWRAAADAMRVPYDGARRMPAAHEGAGGKERFDFDSTEPEHYPLMLHHTYFELYRKQVVKQADLVLALYLHGHAFDAEEARRAFDDQETLTVRDSSLSACIQSIVAAQVGHTELAYDYLAEAALIDLHDYEHNVSDGLHIASLAGAVQAVRNGLGGMRFSSERIVLRPRLPEGIERVRFGIVWHGKRLRVEIEPSQATYRVEGGTLDIAHWDEALTVGAEAAVCPIAPAPRLPRPRQPLHREPERRSARMRQPL